VGSRLVGSNPVIGSTLWELCEVWDVEAADEETFEPVDTEVPLLVVTGQFDQITPLSYGETVADAADTAWYVEVPGVGHAPLPAAGECGLGVLEAFVDQPTDEPDAGCVDEGPGFATPDEIAAQGDEASPAPSPG
jgi:hypothetical protein